MKISFSMRKLLFILAGLLFMFKTVFAGEYIKIGLNYPETGPYSVQGLAQLRAAEMGVKDINASGGILGKKIQLVKRDSKSDAKLAKKNVEDLIDNEGCEMIFGGSASSVAIAGGNAARSRGKIYFGTLTYSNATTGVDGHKYMFRESYSAWMGAKVLSKYLKKTFNGKKYFYITADYTWGRTTEDSIRIFSDTEDTEIHKRALTPFPGAKSRDFKRALTIAKASKADVLVLVLFGKDMAKGLKQATAMGLKKKMSVVVPNLTLGMAVSGGPKVMEGVVGALPWYWKIPYVYGYEKGKRFVEKFSEKYGTYPSTSAASAYTILYEYKNAVERAKTFESKGVIGALEGHKYLSLKDEQAWREFDHQSIQTVYAVKCKSQKEVLKDKYNQDYFEIIDKITGEEAACTRDEWISARKSAGKPLELEW